MDYLEVTIQTASAGIEAVASALTAGGFDSLVVEDQAEYETFLEENRAYWDYIDEDFQQKLEGLSRIKVYLEDTDATVADLMTDGCNMGVKSLNRYLNQYKAADEVSKDIAKRLINLEEKLTIDIRQFL